MVANCWRCYSQIVHTVESSWLFWHAVIVRENSSSFQALEDLLKPSRSNYGLHTRHCVCLIGNEIGALMLRVLIRHLHHWGLWAALALLCLMVAPFTRKVIPAHASALQSSTLLLMILMLLRQQRLPRLALKTMRYFALVKTCQLILNVMSIYWIEGSIILVVSSAIIMLTLLCTSEVVILHHFDGRLINFGILDSLVDRPCFSIRVLGTENFAVATLSLSLVAAIWAIRMI